MAKWNTTPTELLLLVRRALVVLVPVAEAARIPWRDEEAYDDWDAIARVLFEQIAVRSFTSAGIRQDEGFAFPEYGMLFDDYSRYHLIGVLGSNTSERLAFVAFSSDYEPFDLVGCRALDSAGNTASGELIRIPASEARFYIEQRTKNGLQAVPNALSLNL